jgi:hypothetical protein
MNSIIQKAISSGDRTINSLLPRISNFLSKTLFTWAIVFGVSSSISHAIPPSERQVLIDLYNSTNGANWTNRTNWNGAVGTECTWYGVFCTAGDANVFNLSLDNNNLTGTLPATLNQLTALEVFAVEDNEIGGSIPSLTGLTSLKFFEVSRNLLTGSIPPLTGLASIETFVASGNRLTGSIPSLSGLTTLDYIELDQNQLTGSIPSLTGLTALTGFSASENQLTGSIPTLAGLTQLRFVSAYQNRLTGSIPSFAGLTELRTVDVRFNQLTGSVPSLAGTTMFRLQVDANQLTGAIPAAVASLGAGFSSLCPNFLTVSVDAAWDTATGITPWSNGCTPAQATQAMIPGARPILRVGGTGTAAVIVDPSPSSSAPVVFASDTPTICSINSSSGVITVATTAVVGSACVIAATKAGDATFLQAPPIQIAILIRAAAGPTNPTNSAATIVPTLPLVALGLLAALLAAFGIRGSKPVANVVQRTDHRDDND